MSTVTTLLNLVKPASPEQFSLATYNNNLDLIDAKSVSQAALIKAAAKVLGVQSVNVTWGTAPTVNSDIKFSFGSGVFTSDASGYFGVDMPVAFPNGYVVVAMLNGDVSAQGNPTLHLSAGIFTNLATRFYVRMVMGNTGAAIGGGTVRLNYLAIGH